RLFVWAQNPGPARQPAVWSCAAGHLQQLVLRVMALVKNNNLTGPISGNESFNLPMLQVLTLSRNGFGGRIPSGLAACRFLRILSLSYNVFDDVIPAWLPTLSQLTVGDMPKSP